MNITTNFNASSLFAVEFPTFPIADMPAIPAHWEDISWHNDSCPSFQACKVGEDMVHVFIDFADPADREIPETTTRFSVVIVSASGDTETEIETNEWLAVLGAVMDAELTLECENNDGCGSASDEDVRRYADAIAVKYDVSVTLDAEQVAFWDLTDYLSSGAEEAPAPVEAKPFTIHEKIALARAFGEKVQQLPVNLFRQVIDRNKAEEHESICHSHDFVDANDFMLEAFTETFKRAPDLDAADDLAAWNEAWSIAKAADFFA